MARRPEKHDIVLGILRRSRRAVPAEEVVRRVRATDPSIGRATVYRALRALVRRGAAERYPLGYGIPDRIADHHHVVCGSCGRSAVPGLADAERALSSALAREGFAIVSHEIKIEARCVRHR